VKVSFIEGFNSLDNDILYDERMDRDGRKD
jgi:hypothetical protein